MKYLLDTNIISELVKTAPDKSVLEKIQKNENDCSISSITFHELKYGLNRLPESRKKEKIQKFVDLIVSTRFPILSYDEKAAEVHSQFRVLLASEGCILPFADSQIAAIAMANNLILVTRNVKDFTPISGLNIENWFL